MKHTWSLAGLLSLIVIIAAGCSSKTGGGGDDDDLEIDTGASRWGRRW